MTAKMISHRSPAVYRLQPMSTVLHSFLQLTVIFLLTRHRCDIDNFINLLQQTDSDTGVKCPPAYGAGASKYKMGKQERKNLI